MTAAARPAAAARPLHLPAESSGGAAAEPPLASAGCSREAVGGPLLPPVGSPRGVVAGPLPAAVPGRPLPADLLYGRLLASAVQHVAGAGPAPRGRVRQADGRLEPLPLERWLAPADAVDREILARVSAPVLDLGCGPGRHLAALRALDKRGLGVDLSPVAVRLARRRGAEAIPQSLWAELPGGWATILLLDGNIGIGGNPTALLRRAGGLLAPGGRVVVETDPAGAPTRRLRVRLEAPAAVSEWFRWARVGADGIGVVAAAADLAVESGRSLAGRTFVTLRAA